MKQNIKNLWSLTALCLCLFGAMAFTACGSDDDDSTGGGDTPSKYDTKLTQQIPEEYLDKLSRYMTIHQGTSPRTVEGIYLYCPKVVFDETNSYEADHQMAAELLRFSNQNTTQNTLTIEEKFRSNETSLSTNAIILGQGAQFTAVYTSEGTQSGVKFKTATIVSGTWTAEGIKDMEHAVLMLSNDDTTGRKIMPVGYVRVFKEGYNPVSYTMTEDEWQKGFSNN